MIITLSSALLLISCKDEISIPSVKTLNVTEITDTTATSGGEITSDGGATVTAHGVCWSTNQTPTTIDNKTTDGAGVGSFTSAITCLTANTTYYVRAYAVNNKGTGYGSTISFTTIEGDSGKIKYGYMTDIDGNRYKTVIIGTQTWMAENLKVAKYNDGTSIPNITDQIAWWKLTTGACCDYENTPLNSQIYGKLYNWYAVTTGKLCPKGWHLPSDAEWKQLETYLGGYKVAGGKLKETGTIHWVSPNTGATNETGFTALPGGYRDFNGKFSSINYLGSWWSATDSNDVRFNHWIICSIFNDLSSNGSSEKEGGVSVRCVKD